MDNREGVLEKLQSENCRVILADIKMPVVSGIDIYERLHRVAKPFVGRMVLITADVMSEDTMAFLSRAKAPYIAKPFDTEG